MYDDKSQELNAIQNDITIGHYDVRIISGSTLPSNRVAEYNMYLEAYKMNLVDDVEVLKKTEIFDKQGVLQRKGQMSQLQSYVQQLEAQVKKLSGDLQTAEREAEAQGRGQKLRSSRQGLMKFKMILSLKPKFRLII
jgi:hypothetical protein